MNHTLDFFHKLDQIMKQDFGNRGLLCSLPDNPVEQTFCSLASAKRVILLTGFPVKMADGTVVGETDGPCGTADLAAALLKAGTSVLVVTDRPSYELLKEALFYRAPEAGLFMLPEDNTADFIRGCMKSFKPTHFISLERPGKAKDGHCHNMRGEIIDDMLTDSSLFLSEAKKYGAVTISIGDGGNEMGMGAYEQEIRLHVPSGDAICTKEAADLTLAAGVSNWWGWGMAALLSLHTGTSLLPTEGQECESLHRVVLAGGVDGCTKERTETVDQLPMSVHLSILRSVACLVEEHLEQEAGRLRKAISA